MKTQNEERKEKGQIVYTGRPSRSDYNQLKLFLQVSTL
jgi:hypothetical protein